MPFLIRCFYLWILLPAIMTAGTSACNQQSVMGVNDHLVAAESENLRPNYFETRLPSGAASPEEAALYFFNAMINCDTESMRAIILSPTELAAISRKTIDVEKYEQKVREFIAGRKREACERKFRIQLHSLKVIDKRLLRATDSSKIKRDLETAHVMPVFNNDREINYSRSLLFVKSDSGWKLSISH